MTAQAISNTQQTGIAFKGGMFTLTSLQLLSDDIVEIAYQLDEKIKQAPKFFQHAPIIIDVQMLSQGEESVLLDFPALHQLLKAKQLIPIGVRGASNALKEAAIVAGLAIFPEDKIVSKKRSQPESGDNLTLEGSAIQRAQPLLPLTKVITQPVRSGQQIYAAGGDLVILAAVSHGAEVLADGHIHVYGPLRGRALAGIMGNRDAMIFCKSLEAELVSIAGQYRLSDDLKELTWKESVCVQLQEDRLHIQLV